MVCQKALKQNALQVVATSHCSCYHQSPDFADRQLSLKHLPLVAPALDKTSRWAIGIGMTQTQRQRQVRFSPSDDARIEARADAMGMTVPAWMKSVLLRAIDDTDTADVVRVELRDARVQQEKQVADLKAFLFEALVGLGDRIRTSQVNFLQELVAQIPQSQSKRAGLHDLLPPRPNPNFTGTNS